MSSYEILPFEEKPASEGEVLGSSYSGSCPIEIARAYGVELSKSQAEAAIHVEETHAIVAPAGSGKTMVIAARLSSLIRLLNGKGEDRVFATSFTREATRNLRDRVTRLLGRRPGAQISTFHSMSQDIVFSNLETLGYAVVPTVLTRSSAEMRLKSVILEVSGVSKLSDIEDYSVDDVKGWMYGLDVVTLLGDSDRENLEAFLPPDEFFGIATAIHSTYHRLNLEACVIDFDELLSKALEVIQKKGNAAFPCDYVFVDEAQDLNAIQWEILKLVKPKLKSLVLIGDDDQSIYRFRGATPKEFLAFVESADKKFILPENRRSLGRIVSFSDDIMSVVPEGRRVVKSISHVRTGEQGKDGDVVFIAPCEVKSFLVKEVNEIKKRFDKARDSILGDYAFLQRYSGPSGKILQGVLLAAGLPYVVRGGGSVFDDDEARYIKAVIGATDRRIKIINHMKSKSGKNNDVRTPASKESSSFWQEIMDALGVSLDAAAKVINNARDLCIETDDGLVADDVTHTVLYEEHLFQALSKSRIKQETRDLIFKTIEDVKVSANLAAGDISCSFRAITQETELISIVTQIAKREARRIATARQKRGGLSKEKADEIALDLAKSRTESIFTALEPVLDMPLKEVNARFEVDDEASTGEKEGTKRIVISTVHSAKGLEWKTVYVLDLSGVTWPPGWGAKDEDDTDEERRLFYVAVTRARDSLFLIGPGESYDGQSFVPTPFVNARIGRVMSEIFKKSSSAQRAMAVALPTLRELTTEKNGR